MWALRRASSNSIRAQGLNIAAFRASSALGPFDIHNEDTSSSSKYPMLDRLLTSQACYYAVQVSNRFLVGNRSLSSQAGAKSGGEEEDDLEDGFSELETLEASKTTKEGDDVNDDTTSSSESDLSGDEENLEDALETELMVDTEVEAEERVSKKKKPTTALCKLILDERGPFISDALDKYVADGKDLSRSEIYDTFLQLRRRKWFGKALQLSEWLETSKKLDFVERDYASRVDLIAKVRDLQKAENYIEKIPKSFRKEVVYRTLLANSVSFTNVKKAQEAFYKMKDLGFPISSFSCNQLLLLYKRTDRKKIADVLLMMEKEKVKPTLFTYLLLIDTKGQANDIVGMDQIVETMKAEGIEPTTRVKATLARHYAAAGLKEKAEALLKEMEGSNLNLNRWMCPILLPIYADLGKADEVERVWKVCESKQPQIQDCLSAIQSWGKLKNVEKAEAIFTNMQAKKRLTSKQYSVMLRVYADNKMLSKGKELVKKMGDSGCHIGPVTWDALVKLYVDAGEVEKADSVLQKAIQQIPQQKPLFGSYMMILDQYSRRGDIHNTEKIFHRLRQAGYTSRARPFHSLLQAYINAKVPAYGIRERMKVDNVFPNKGLAAQLSQVDAFRRTAVSDLLD